MAATALLKSVNGGGSVCPTGVLKTKWTNWMCNRAANRTPAGGGKSAVSHTHTYDTIYARTLGSLGTQMRREMDMHAHRLIRIEMNQLAGIRQSAWERDGGRKKEGAEGKKALKHSVWRRQQRGKCNWDTFTLFKEAHVARGKSILTQRVGNVARCVGWHWYYSQRETEEEKVKGVQTQREEDGSVKHSSLTQESADDQEERPLTFNKWYYCGHGNTSQRPSSIYDLKSCCFCYLIKPLTGAPVALWADLAAIIQKQ